TKRTQLRAFIAATLRAMREIEADPQKGLDASVATVPALGQDRALQLAILKATVATWSNNYTLAHGEGSIDQAAWATTVSFMAGLPSSPISGPPPPVPPLVDTSLLPGCAPSRPPRPPPRPDRSAPSPASTSRGRRLPPPASRR